MRGPELAYSDVEPDYEFFILYDISIRNQTLKNRKADTVEYRRKECHGDIHCIGYFIYLKGRIVEGWSRPKTTD